MDVKPATDEHAKSLVDNLAMLLRRCCYRLRKHKEHVEDEKLAAQATEFLRANSLLGSVLREDE